MSTADRLIAKGRDEGLTEGRTEGRAEMLLRLFTARFGDVPVELRVRVLSGSSEDLDRWGDRVFAAQSLPEVFAAPSGDESNPVRAAVMRAAEKLIEKGRSEGRAEGRASGRVEMLLHMVAARFGDLPAELRTRVRNGTGQDLDRWADRVFAAQSLADVFGL